LGADEIAKTRRIILAEEELPAGILPNEADPWVRKTFVRGDGSFNAAAFAKWFEEQELKLLEEKYGPLQVTEYDKWMSVWLMRLVEEADMFMGNMVPMLPSYYEGYDKVPWQDWYLWAIISEVRQKEIKRRQEMQSGQAGLQPNY